MKSTIKKLIKIPSKRLLGVTDPRLLFNRAHTNIRKKIYREKYNVKDLAEFLESLGVKYGDTIFVPSSWSEFYNFDGDVKELILILRELIGPKGNLAMPSNTALYQNGHVFNVRRTPTNAGIVAEYFRRTKGVERSIHLNSSVCVLGPDAYEIISNHQKSRTSWDENSPHHKLYSMNAKIIALGCGYFFTMGTPWHCVDSQLIKENEFFKDIYMNEIQYEWVGRDGNVGSAQCLIRNANTNLKFINKYLKDVPHINKKLSNLKGYSVEIKPLVDKGIDLAKKGITMYGRYK